MATISKSGMKQQLQQNGAPYGNLSVLQFNLTTNASGVWTGGDSTSAIGATDKLRLGILPAGMILQGGETIISDAFTATVTAKLGFEYVDGVDDSTVAQDDDYFVAASFDMATAARTAFSRALAPVKLPKDAYLIYTNAVAAHSAVGIADFLIKGVIDGAA